MASAIQVKTRSGLADEAHCWLKMLKTPREIDGIGFTGLVSSIGHLAYHLGAMRQIASTQEGAF